jgi:perosamine synthetase
VTDVENIIGFNYRMTELEAAVSVGQFKRLDSLTSHRVKLAEYLTHKLSKFEGLVLPKIAQGCTHVFFTYPIKFDEKKVGVTREVFVKALNAEGVPFGAGYVRPIYQEPAYQRKIGYGKKGCPFTCGFYKGRPDYKKGLCPVTERMYEKELILTRVCRDPHRESDIDDVVKAFEKIFAQLPQLRNSQLQ